MGYKEIKTLAATFATVDWFVPPYIQLGVLFRLAKRLDEAAPDAKRAILVADLEEMYGPRDLAAMLVERYRKIAFISEFATVVEEAIEATQLGLSHVAVASMLPVIEGVLRRMATARGANPSSR